MKSLGLLLLLALRPLDALAGDACTPLIPPPLKAYIPHIAAMI